ncbi:little elongation complex subunit 1 [Drosophila mojavensis]|uniref:Little elongation complex subunit 1 n=1 Tax=Drosophila mojavensis TaxID=7230 RepID=B4KSE7_DROMO|nr:little elongation complex subunit 1 [Drosophila mojavensis]EDW09452.1 uncharacterized protein Dmoj_GI19025 [Drosophila mojavensis]
MSDDFSLDDFGFLLSPPIERSPNEMVSTNGKLSKKRLLIGDLIADNDELVRRVKELEGQEQQLCSIKRTASEVTELYMQEKQQRIELERRALEESERCSDLEKQLDVLKLDCEQLQAEAKLKCLPVDGKDMVILFMQLALRIQGDPCSGGLTRAEHNMLRKLKDYCKSADISVPLSKSPTKKRAKSITATKSTSTETFVAHASAPTKPMMCSIAVQSERFVTTRDQGIQHKNTTTTRGTTTAALIKTRTVGTCFPQPEPPLDAYQILEKILTWTIMPVSPLPDEPLVPEELPLINVGTNTDICDVHREIDYLPVLPAQLKRSDSRPPSRTMHDSVKDELTTPIDAATPDSYSHTMAKKLFNFLPHSQRVLDKMPPQDFEEIWQVVGQMLLVALQSRPANSISQADFREWFCSLYESHQTHNDAPSIDISNKEQYMAPVDEEVPPDDRNRSIETPPPEMGLELTPIRLTQFKEMEELNTKPKIKEQNSCSQEYKRKKKKEKKKNKKKEQSRPTSPTETAVNFLTNLSDFHNSNCDNLDIQLNAEERELMQLASATANNMLPPNTSPVFKDFIPIMDASLNVDKPQSTNPEPLDSHAANVDVMALFGSDSDSTDEEAFKNRKVVASEVNICLSSKNSSNTEKEIPNDCDVRHKDTPPKPNLVINNGGLGGDKTNRLQRKRKLSSRNSSNSHSGTSEDENSVTNDGHTYAEDANNIRIRGLSESLSETSEDENIVTSDHSHEDDTNNLRIGGLSESPTKTNVKTNSVTSDDHPQADYTNNTRGRISSESQSDAREQNAVTSNRRKRSSYNSLSESTEDTSVTSDAEDTKLRTTEAKQPSQGAATVSPVKRMRRVSKRIALKKKSTINDKSVDANQSVDDNSVFDDTDRHDMDENKLAVIIPTEITKQDTSTIKCEKIDESEDYDTDIEERNLIINEDIQTDNEPINEILPSVLIDKHMPEMSEDSSKSDVPVINSGLHSDSDHDEDTCPQNNVDGPTVISNSSESNASDPLVDLYLTPEYSDEDKQQNRKRKRKRNGSMNDSFESQCTAKRLTRLQAKQLQLDADNQESSNGTAVQESCLYESSPMSPAPSDSCEANGSEPIEIPLQLPGRQNNLGAPKALLCYMINAYKADIKKHRNQKPRKRLDKLTSQIIEYLKQSDELELTPTEFMGIDEQNVINVLIAAYGVATEAGANDMVVLQRVLTLVKQFESENSSFIGHFMKALEQRLFNPKDRLSDPVAFMCVKLFLQLIGLQAMQADPVEIYENPARLFLAKILYHYSTQMPQLVLEVLTHYPTVLPHREERSYDHSDPLITVIKHLLMCYPYDVSDQHGAERALISKLRYEYHFQPYEPTKQKVIENLMGKIKAGRTYQLSYAFALFCRRSIQLNVTNVLSQQLIPLVNNYCDLCVQNEEYDARMESLVQCTSMIIKQLRLAGNVDLTGYLALFKRILVAVPRPGIQEAAVQAILRMQRFGYEFVVDALQSYKPNYPLSPMTRAMLRSFVERRQQYLLAKKA